MVEPGFVIARRALGENPPPWPESLHPLLRRLYEARRVTSPCELEHSLEHLLPPGGLKGLEAGVSLLVESLRQGKRLLVVADFDADGATSCALLVRGLRALGAEQVDYLVPNRFEYGYGLTPEIVAVAAQQRPDLIITVDNGISSLEGVRAAQALGIQVLITDHHLPGEQLPAANAIINPNQPGDEFPSKFLAGVGVVFYVLLALRTRLREQAWFIERQRPEPNLAQWLDVVALGTVADVVPLDHNNRILVAQGLRRINAGVGCAGIRALLKVAGREPGKLTATDLAFLVAPRLNAAGRLEDMSLGIACLLSDHEAEALALAERLDQLNRERRSIESSMQVQAMGVVDALAKQADLPRGLCLFDESWHQGVIGILAARIKERFHRPVIAFAPAGEANAQELKGSARSVPGLHIRDALDAVATRYPHLLQKFGGHAMAAGLSLARADLPAFRLAFAEEVARHLNEDDLCGRLWSDGELRPEDLDLNLAEALQQAGPWGQGFPEPLFDGSFEVVQSRVVGESKGPTRHLKMTLKHPQGKLVDAIAFNTRVPGDLSGRAIHAAYRLDVNEFRGNRTLQLIITHLSLLDSRDPPI